MTLNIVRLEAGATLSVCLDGVQTYASTIKRAEKRVIVNSETISTYTRCLQVAIVMKKLLNISQGLITSE